MPAYITHAIMADQLTKANIFDESIFKIPVDIDNMRTFSLGADLSFFSSAEYDSHNKDTFKFFYNFVDYIIDNNLRDNPKVMSCLYGHITHYFLDTCIHPLVYYLDIDALRGSNIISNHALIEGYYDYYLTNIYGYNKIDPTFFNKGDLKDEKTIYMINNVYRTTYNTKDVIKSYRKVLNLLSMLEKSTKGLMSPSALAHYSGFNKFLELNDYTIDTLLNNDASYWKNSITGDMYYIKFNNLFNRSMELTLEAINIVNSIIYDNKSLDLLSNIFYDLSYDTGVKCEYGRKFKYTKKGLNK